MHYFIPQVISLHGGTILTTRLADPKAIINSPYGETIEYINGFINIPVSVTDRNGITLIIPSNPPRSGKYNNLFVIRRRIIADYPIISSLMDSLARMDNNDPDTNDYVRSIKSYLEFKENSENAHSRFDVHLDTVITPEDFNRAGGTVYSVDTDLVISNKNIRRKILHPRSLEAQRMARLVEHVNSNDPLGLFYKVEIVDNLGVFGKRFFRIASKVFSITPIKDPIRRNGVYVTKTSQALSEQSFNEIIEKYYTFEEAEKELLLFRTYEQARVDGDISTQRKLELGELEHETVRLKAQASHEAAKEKVVPDLLKKIIDIIKPMSVILISIFGGVKLIYGLGKAAGSVVKK